MVLGALPALALGVLILGPLLAVGVTLQFSAGRDRTIAALATILLIGSLAAWDVVAGRIQFQKLCANDSGMQIHARRQIEPSDRTDLQIAWGNLSSYQFMQLAIAKRYSWTVEENSDLPGPGKIKRVREQLTDNDGGESLGTLTVYHWGGGWMSNALSTAPGAGGGSCGHGQGYFDTVLRRVFDLPDA
jgi:hypothetical protein